MDHEVPDALQTDEGESLDFAFVLYDQITALDIVGPWQTLHSPMSPHRFHLVAPQLAPVRTDSGMTIVPTTTFEQLRRADVIVVPGTSVPAQTIADGRVSRWLREVAPTARWLTSVCTGTLLLADAGLLEGRTAATHWAWRSDLADSGVRVSEERVVRDGNVITGGGITAGIDFGLTLAAELWGQPVAAVRHAVLEYRPQPPLPYGSPDRLPDGLREQVYELMQSHAQWDRDMAAVKAAHTD
ncbi:DJ-1/PfpI family protein [Streptomyces longwoodensis]|uniref:DJ-1/PfpI family protein n=1 Tax=Streptomyces longwoodensis TaxID=68231 RepID=UPI0033F393CE